MFSLLKPISIERLLRVNVLFGIHLCFAFVFCLIVLFLFTFFKLIISSMFYVSYLSFLIILITCEHAASSYHHECDILYVYVLQLATSVHEGSPSPIQDSGTGSTSVSI